METQSIKVWDPIVRIGHWTLVIAFFTAYLTEDDFMTQHIWAGYVVGTVVCIRILWGLFGTGKHARFSDFIYKPAQVFGYLKGLIQGKAQHYVGHNPAGGAMVIALLLSLCGTVYSGLALYAVEDHAGPFANIYGSTSMTIPSIDIIQPAQASSVKSHDEDDHDKAVMAGDKAEQDEAFWEGLHEFFANFTLLLVALHIAGVILSSKIDKENLIKAMITGKKVIKKDHEN
jgi:cytochrome b